MSANVLTKTMVIQETNSFLPTLLKAELDCDDVGNASTCLPSHDECSIKAEEEISGGEKLRVEVKKLTISADDQLTFFICSSCDEVCSSRLRLALHSGSNSTKCVKNNSKSTYANHTSKSVLNSPGSSLSSNLLAALRPRQRGKIVIFQSKSNSVLRNASRSSHMRSRKCTPRKYKLADTLPKDEYNCNNCEQSFSRKSQLKRHIHHCCSDETQLFFDQVRRIRETKGPLGRPKPTNQISFDTEANVLCHYCGKMFAKVLLVKHKCFAFLKRKFACNLCNKSYHSNYLLKKHKVRHTGKKPYRCGLCKISFGSTAGLYIHNFSHKGKPFNCDLCDRAFVRKSQLKAHRPVHFGDKQHVCNQCGKRYVLKTSLRKHIRQLHENSPLTCSYCERKFVRKEVLGNHILGFHLDFKEYVCEQCGSAFRLKRQLRFHLRKHFGIKRFTCDHCDNSYSTKVGLLLHKKRIAGEIECAKCPICNKSYSTKQSLERHMLSHTGEKAFKCEQCDKAFTQKATLARHMVCHSAVKPYCCQHCGKSYSQVTTYKVHLRKHNNVKPFTCHHCSESFTSKDILKTHMRSHFSSKTFPCDVCYKVFTSGPFLGKHKLTHVEKEETVEGKTKTMGKSRKAKTHHKNERIKRTLS